VCEEGLAEFSGSSVMEMETMKKNRKKKRKRSNFTPTSVCLRRPTPAIDRASTSRPTPSRLTTTFASQFLFFYPSHFSFTFLTFYVLFTLRCTPRYPFVCSSHKIRYTVTHIIPVRPSKVLSYSSLFYFAFAFRLWFCAFFTPSF